MESLKKMSIQIYRGGPHLPDYECLRGDHGEEARAMAEDFVRFFGGSEAGERELRKIDLERRGAVPPTQLQQPDRERLRLEILKRIR